MKTLLKEIRHSPLLWLLVFVPVVFIAGEVIGGRSELITLSGSGELRKKVFG